MLEVAWFKALFNVTWFNAVGTSAALFVADMNMPLEGFEKLGALGVLALFVYFTLTRLETSIKENAAAVKENATAIRDLKTYLEVQEARHGHE